MEKQLDQASKKRASALLSSPRGIIIYHILACALLLPSVCSAELFQYEIPAQRLRLDSAERSGGIIKPLHCYDCPKEGTLWIEAEAASQITGPIVQVNDPDTGGGVYLHVPDQTYRGRGAKAVFSINISTAGKYRFWARMFWPNIGSNSFYISVDDGEEAVFGNTEGANQIGRWFWLADEPRQLSAGIHTLVLRWREDGTRLDKAAISADPKFSPTGLGGAAARPRYPKEIHVETSDIRPPRVEEWRGVAIEPRELHDTVSIDASDDGGKTWSRLPPNGDISKFRCRGDGTDTIRFRLTIAPLLQRNRVLPKNSVSQERRAVKQIKLESMMVTYIGQPSTMRLESTRAAFTFNLMNGGLTSVEVKQGEKRRRVLEGAGGALVGLKFLRTGGKAVKSAPREGIKFLGAEREGDTISLRYMARVEAGELRARCTVTLPKDKETSLWRVTVENGAENLELIEVEFPIIEGVRIGTEARDDWLIWPEWGAGRRIPNPALRAPGRGLYLGGSGIMNWLDVYDTNDGGAGLYLASYDMTLLTGALIAEADSETQTVTLGMSKMPRVRPGETFTSEPFALAAHQGDWHWAADRYREWLTSWMKPYNPPDWLVESDGWLGRGRGASFMKDIPAAYQFARELGLNHVEFWGQMMVGLGAGAGGCNRLYFPDPRYGTETDFAKAIKYVRDAGGHIGFYTNGQAWNPRYPKLRPEYEGLLPPQVVIPDWEKGFKKFALIRADGSFVPQYRKPDNDPSPYPCSFYLMCAHAKGWQDYLYHYIVEKYVKEYGVDHIYVDQLGAAPAQPCFASGHGHDDCIGAWTRGNVEKFRRLKTGGRKHEPQFSISTEGFGDVYGQYVDAFLISPASCRVWPYSAPEIVRYTLPDYILFDGFANGSPGGGSKSEVLFKVFLLGNRFDLFTAPGEFAELCKKVIRLRQETSELLYRGRFMDETGLTISDANVRAKIWRLDNDDARGCLVNFYNPQRLSGVTAQVRVGNASAVRKVFLAHLGAPLLAPTTLKSDGESIRLDIPQSEIGTFLLIERAKPCLLRAWASLTVIGAENRIELRFRPISGDLSEVATARIVGPRDWEATTIRFSTDASRDVLLPVRCPPSASPGGQRVAVEVVSGAFHWKKVIHLLLVERFQASLRISGAAVELVLSNRAGEKAVGECRIEAPPELRLTKTAQRCEIPANGASTVRFPFQGRKAQNDITIRGVFTSEGKQIETAAKFAKPDLSASNWSHHLYKGKADFSIDKKDTADETLIIESATEQDRPAWSWRSRSLLPGTKWQFTAEVKTEDIVSHDKGAWVRIIFFHRTKPNTATAPWVTSQPFIGSRDWTPIRLELTVPPDTGIVQIELFHHFASGRSFWRKLKLE